MTRPKSLTKTPEQSLAELTAAAVYERAAAVAWCGEWRIGPDTGHGDPNADYGDDEPDAKLIAAAPDLAEALRLTVETLERDSVEYDDVRNVLETARAALAKAGVS